MSIDELLTILGRCKIYDLEQVRYAGMPAFDPVQPGLLYFLYRHHENYYKPETDGPRTSASGLILMSDQSGTHIDALSHQASDMMLPNGVKVSPEIETPWGFTKHRAEQIAPIFSRGIMVDVAGHAKEPLPEEHQVTLEEFNKATQSCGVTIKKGDVVFVRVGYGRYWNDLDKYKKAAGISKEVSLLLRDQNVFAVGADNLAWDVPGFRDPATRSLLPGHLHLLSRSGIHIIENAYLEELSKDKVSEFLFIGLPLKFKGATGSPLRPIAVRPL